jgi:hypothetical protein
VRASYPSDAPDTRWQRLMSKSFGGLCEPGQRRENCLSLLDDVMGLSEWDKLGVALGLSIDPLKESIAKAVENTLAPQLFYTVLAVTVVVSHGMIGGAALLSSRLSMLPSFSEAAAAGASRSGINLANVGQVSAVAVVGSTVVISLPATAVAMAARSAGGHGRTDHGEERAAEARDGDAHRQVGDANRVIREGRKFVDTVAGTEL